LLLTIYKIIMMIWAEHCHRLESLPLLSAQWQGPSLERWRQIFFGGVFDKRVRMLFAARSPEFISGEDGNVHRRDGVSKTVTKNMWVGFFRDFRILFIADATGATDEDLHLSSLRNIAFGFGKVLLTEDILNV